MYHQHTLQPSNGVVGNVFKGVKRIAGGLARGGLVGKLLTRSITNTKTGGLSKKAINKQKKKLSRFFRNKVAEKIANKTQGNNATPTGNVATPTGKDATLNKILIALQNIQRLLQTDTKIAKFILVKNVNEK